MADLAAMRRGFEAAGVIFVEGDGLGPGVKVRIKTGFAFNHLQVAVKFARDAHEIEQANITKPFGPRFDGMMEVGAGISGNGRRGVGSQRKRGASEHAR